MLCCRACFGVETVPSQVSSRSPVRRRWTPPDAPRGQQGRAGRPARCAPWRHRAHCRCRRALSTGVQGCVPACNTVLTFDIRPVLLQITTGHLSPVVQPQCFPLQRAPSAAACQAGASSPVTTLATSSRTSSATATMRCVSHQDRHPRRAHRHQVCHSRANCAGRGSCLASFFTMEVRGCCVLEGLPLISTLSCTQLSRVVRNCFLCAHTG